MGAWGSGIYDNDEALDFLSEIEGDLTLETLEYVLDKLLEKGTGYLELSDAAASLVTADIVARILGHKGKVPEVAELKEQIAHIKAAPGKQLIDKGHRAVSRVLTEPSEMLELWQEADEFEGWKSSVEDLLRRLQQ